MTTDARRVARCLPLRRYAAIGDGRTLGDVLEVAALPVDGGHVLDRACDANLGILSDQLDAATGEISATSRRRSVIPRRSTRRHRLSIAEGG